MAAPLFVALGDLSIDTILIPAPRLIKPSACIPLPDTDAKDADEHIEDGPQAGQYPEQHWLKLRTPGGTWLLAEMLQTAIALHDTDDASNRVLSYARPKTLKINNAGFPAFRKYEHFLPEAVTLVHRFPKRAGDANSDNDFDRVYRIRESLGRINRLLGEPIQSDVKPSTLSRFLVTQCSALQKSVNRLRTGKRPPPLVTLILDRNLGFRESVPKSALDIIHQSDAVIWKMDSPIATGPLWEAVSATDNVNKVILVIKEECLRQAGINIRKEGSIERTFQEFASQLQPHKRLHALAECRHLVVNFGHGAILYDSKRGMLGSVTHLSSKRVGGNSKLTGDMAGYTTILMATIAKSIGAQYAADATKAIDFETIFLGARLGAFLGEQHFARGYAGGDFFKKLDDKTRHVPLPKPFSTLFQSLLPGKSRTEEEICEYLKGCEFSEFVLDLKRHDPNAAPLNLETWCRYEELWKQGSGASSETIGIDIVRRGVAATTAASVDTKLPYWLPRITRRSPCVSYGVIQSLFRDEIDRFASIEFLVSDYLRHSDRRRPLSLACFGAPGAGKGFTVKQILCRISPEVAKNSLNFNISQFSSVRDLAVALHQVQDRVLSNETPLVVFDEFDTSLDQEPWGWLKYFLAPMQDGNFKEGESTYRIGRAIFLFVGGISHTFHDFAVKNREKDEFKEAKGPDFVSRLRGHLDIEGINHIAGQDQAAIILRRAIILRQLIEQHLGFIVDPATKIARIEPEVIRAFLGVDAFEHGVRSMEAIVEMSHISPTRKSYTRSSIPAPAQLSMHVNADKFEEILGS